MAGGISRVSAFERDGKPGVEVEWEGVEGATFYELDNRVGPEVTVEAIEDHGDVGPETVIGFINCSVQHGRQQHWSALEGTPRPQPASHSVR